jgi:putative SOS response-associated peptidase YedK
MAVKPTFKKTFETQRCIVPCTGWYEWRSEGGPKKQKYAFTHADGIPFLMAGIWFGGATEARLVTLTTSPGKRCAEIHNRTPLLIDPENVSLWLNESAIELGPMLAENREDHIVIRQG